MNDGYKIMAYKIANQKHRQIKMEEIKQHLEWHVKRNIEKKHIAKISF